MVTCIGSLEHTPDPTVGLRELVRVSRKFIVIVFPLWYVDKDGPISRHYLQEPTPNIERWLRPDEWDDLVIGATDDWAVLQKRELIHSETDIMYVLEKPNG